MSHIPYNTQVGPRNPDTQDSSEKLLKVIHLVHTDKMNERESDHMAKCRSFFSTDEMKIVKCTEIHKLSKNCKHFVIPSNNETLIKKIRKLFPDKAVIIYLARAVIEAREYHNVNLPVRKLSISLTMFYCRIFLTKTCNVEGFRNKIYEMCGTIVRSFSRDDPNVVITHTAEDKYCAKAFKNNIPVVSKAWVDKNHEDSVVDDPNFFNKDAMANISEHKIKPFYGLHFRIVPGTSPQIIKFISKNEGQIIFGEENCTHIVVPTGHRIIENQSPADSANESSQGPRVVDEEFLKACVKVGYYMQRSEYEEHRKAAHVVVKQEQHSQRMSSVHQEDDYIAPISNGYSNGASENMLPPPQVPRPLVKHPPDNMNDMILKALSTFENAQTQLASTQMRRLPDPELRIEQTFEPSQQLYWNDSVSRRN